MYNKIMITPNTDLILLQCPIELDQRNQLTFSNATAQYNYFYGLNKLEQDGFTYQRKDGKIRYPACADDLWQYNYCMYRNTSHGNKWFYAFITDIEYLNDNTSLISIKTDVWQSWQFDLEFKRSFVTREHTNNDAFGSNILDEGINVGEYTCNATSNLSYMSDTQDYYVAVEVTELLGDHSMFVSKKKVYGGLPQGTWIMLNDINSSNPDNAKALDNLIYAYDKAGKADAITAMYVMPKSLAGTTLSWSLVLQINATETIAWDGYIMPVTTSATSMGRWEWDRQTTLDGYVPKNNKCLIYPYNYLMVSNNAGKDNVYHWEDFASSQAWFSLKGTPVMGCQIRAIPEAYKGTSLNAGYAWSCTAPELPQVSWNSDYYLNWRAKEGIDSGINAVNKYASDYLIDSKSKEYGGWEEFKNQVGETFSAPLRYVGSIFSELKGGYSASITPDETRGTVTGSLTFSMGLTCFTGYKMSVKYQQAKAIDDYFSMFGYRTDQVKLPNRTGRLNWNFVQTNGCNIVANIPQSDLQEIKGMFDNGITLWHNASTFLDYSQNNNIV